MQSHSTPPSFTFHDLSLREAEEEAVAAAIDYEHALLSLYGATRIRSFRSEQAYELNQIANVLFLLHDRGWYEPERNRRILEQHFDPGYIHDLCCPNAAVIEYADALCMALVRGEELHDEAVDARWREINEAPFRPAPPQPARQRPHKPPSPTRKGGFIGVVPL